MQANSHENITWPGGGGVGASQTPPPPPHIRHSLLSFLPLGSFSIGFWISTSIPKLMYFPSFLFDMGVSWGGVTLTLLASAGMKKPCNKLGSLSYFWDETRRPRFWCLAVNLHWNERLLTGAFPSQVNGINALGSLHSCSEDNIPAGDKTKTLSWLTKFQAL